VSRDSAASRGRGDLVSQACIEGSRRYDRPVLGPVDHVGYITRDLEAGIAVAQELFGLDVVRRFERPPWNLQGAYLGSGDGHVEVFTFGDASVLEGRIGSEALRLDHVAYLVEDIHTYSAQLRARGVRFGGPDLRGEIDEPVDLGGVLHLWTLPETCGGTCLQLMQR
jgi:catechol 2,3-dioxygenase-like lactoylglutathione lyase family enzyme